MGWRLLARMISGYGGKVAPLTIASICGQNDVRASNLVHSPAVYIPSAQHPHTQQRWISPYQKIIVDGSVQTVGLTQQIPSIRSFSPRDTQGIANLNTASPSSDRLRWPRSSMPV